MIIPQKTPYKGGMQFSGFGQYPVRFRGFWLFFAQNKHRKETYVDMVI